MLPVWSYVGLETWCMIGYHAVAVIADAYMKGIRGYDAKDALKAMISTATYGPYDGLEDYMQLGYVPIDKEKEAPPRPWNTPSMTGPSRAWPRPWAGATPPPVLHRAANWRNVFDPKTGFIRARRPTAASASLSTPPPWVTAATTPKAMPGSTPGTSPRTSPV